MIVKRAWFEFRNWWFFAVTLPVAYWRERARYALFVGISVDRDIMASRGPWWAITCEPTSAPVEDLEGCVGAGWRLIVRHLVADLFRVGWEGGVTTVKEKFGALRFYCNGDSTPALWHAINCAEDRSVRTCEECGEPGRLRGNGWLYTSCDEHAKVR